MFSNSFYWNMLSTQICTHKMLNKSSGIESIALRKQLAGFLLSQVCSNNKELCIESCFPRLPDCQGTQVNQIQRSVGMDDDDDGDSGMNCFVYYKSKLQN